MLPQKLVAALVIGGVVMIVATAVGQEKKAPEERKGAVVGRAVAKGGFWIEVQADGEEMPRKYYCGSDQVALKAVKTTEVGSRLRLEWRFQEVFRVVRIEVLKAPSREKK